MVDFTQVLEPQLGVKCKSEVRCLEADLQAFTLGEIYSPIHKHGSGASPLVRGQSFDLIEHLRSISDSIDHTRTIH